MKKRWFTLTAFGALALLLASPGTSSAILFGGYSPPGYGWGGYGLAYPGMYGAGYRVPWLGYGLTYGYPGVTLWPSSYVGYGSTYAPSRFAYSPGYRAAAPLFTRSSSAGGATTAAPDADTTAVVQVEVPADATLWFDGVQTKQTGALRTFHTPPLERGHSYHYDVKARWEEDGKSVERTRRVDVYPGARVTVDFDQPSR